MHVPKALRNSGLKATLPRIRVLELFQSQAIQHVTAEVVYQHLLQENINIGIATVYRVLMQFVEAGILVRNQFDMGPAVFELNMGVHHDHLICTRCGKVEEFSDPEIEGRQHTIASTRGFTLVDHQLALYGQCSQCRPGNPG